MPNQKVIFTGASEAQINWGGNNDPNKVCEVGKEYEIESENIHSWHTKITLVGIEGVFNSVSFKPVTDTPRSVPKVDLKQMRELLELAYNGGQADSLLELGNRLADEIERLRAALEEIDKMTTMAESMNEYGMIHQAGGVARAALHTGEESSPQEEVSGE